VSSCCHKLQESGHKCPPECHFSLSWYAPVNWSVVKTCRFVILVFHLQRAARCRLYTAHCHHLPVAVTAADLIAVFFLVLQTLLSLSAALVTAVVSLVTGLQHCVFLPADRSRLLSVYCSCSVNQLFCSSCSAEQRSNTTRL
jgi:hypothetical protein